MSHSVVLYCLANFRMLRLLKRRDALIVLISCSVKVREGGLPIRIPRERANSIPALTRSAITPRSSSAIAPTTVKIILPIGQLVSMFSETETN